METNIDPKEAAASKLVKSTEKQINRVVQDTVAAMTNNKRGHCMDGDAIDGSIERKIAESIDLKKEKIHKDDKKVSDKFGYNRYMIESIWIVGKNASIEMMS